MQENIIDEKSIRDKLSSRIDVLKKVKNVLAYIPATTGSTIQQVADFYEVGIEAIKTIVKRHNDELFEDGLRTVESSKIKEKLGGFKMNLPNMGEGNFVKLPSELRNEMGMEYIPSPKIVNFRGYFTANGVKINNRSNLIFTRRAVLRVGMLLRDSEIAREIRTQLLNIEEKAEVPVKVADIDEEQKLLLELGKAMASGDFDKLQVATMNYNKFNNRHIQQLKETNHSLAAMCRKYGTTVTEMIKDMIKIA